MRAIRMGCFETNSSSMHTLCICTEELYEAWKNGEATLVGMGKMRIYPKGQEPENTGAPFDLRRTYDDYWETADQGMLCIGDTYTTPNGEKIRVFGEVIEHHGCD